eukprot:227212_1
MLVFNFKLSKPSQLNRSFSMRLSIVFVWITCAVTYNAKKNPLSVLQMQQVLQMVSGMNHDLSCNLSSINPAVLLAQGFDTKTIMSELSQVASLMYSKAHQECQDLHLSSTQCLEDCISYNHPITLFKDTSSPSFYPSLIHVLELYSVSASPIGWYDVGNPDQCDYFGGQYCYTPLVSVSAGMAVSMPHGCCIPSSCTASDAVKVVTHNPYCFGAFNASFSQMYAQMGTKVNTAAFCQIPPRNTTSFGFIMAVLIPSVFVVLVLIASCRYQYRSQHKPPVPSLQEDLNVNLNAQNKVERTSPFLNIFSIHCIWHKLVSHRAADKSSLNFLDGMRVLSMSWVILGHSFMYFFLNLGSNGLALFPMFPGAPNSTQHTYLVNKLPNILIQYAFYSVDTFFWLSGLLAAFSIYRNVKRLGENTKWYKWIPMAYVTRYLRIVPMMMFAVLLQWKVLDQLPSGPHTTSRDENNALCSDNWWKLLLLQANLWLTKDNSDALSCMGHLWYLQVDWQCYLLLPWLVALFIRNKTAGIVCSLLPFVACIGIRFYLAFYYHFGANFLMPPAAVHGGNVGNQAYFKPWPRMAVYFIGVTLTFVMITINEWYNKHRNGRFVLYKWSYVAVIAGSMLIFGCLMIWPYNDVKHAPEERWSLSSNEVYFALCRPAWGVALSLFAFGLRYLDTKQTSVIKNMLSLSVFETIGKVTYTMYLLHLIVFAWWAGDSVMPSYYNTWFIVLLFIGIWSVTAGISLMLYVFMESPINAMVMMCVKRMSKCRSPINPSPSENNVALQLQSTQYNKFTNQINTFSIVKTGNI